MYWYVFLTRNERICFLIHLVYVVWIYEIYCVNSSRRATPHPFERDSNLRSSTCKSLALPRCYGYQQTFFNFMLQTMKAFHIYVIIDESQLFMVFKNRFVPIFQGKCTTRYGYIIFACKSLISTKRNAPHYNHVTGVIDMLFILHVYAPKTVDQVLFLNTHPVLFFHCFLQYQCNTAYSVWHSVLYCIIW